VPDALCTAHKNRGIEVVAYKVINGVPLCIACVEGIPINVPNRFPVRVDSDESEVAVTRKDIDWGKILEERAAGATAKELSDKYGVSTQSVYLHGSRSKKAAAPKPSNNGHAVVGNVDISDILIDLRQRRDKLNAAIEALEYLAEVKL